MQNHLVRKDDKNSKDFHVNTEPGKEPCKRAYCISMTRQQHKPASAVDLMIIQKFFHSNYVCQLIYSIKSETVEQ